MADAVAAARPGTRRALLGRPALVAEAAVVAGWAGLLAHAAAVETGLHTHSSRYDAVALGLWVLMAAAMMVPSAMPAVRHVAANSLRWRRHRAVAEYLAAYLGVWAAFGAVLLALVTLWRPPLVAVLLVAAAWQVTPAKRAALRGCHRTVPLPPTGRSATEAAVRFGRRNGYACLGSCWGLMAVMAVAPGHVLWAAAFAVVAYGEKVRPRPRRTSRAVGAALVAVALLGMAGAAVA